MKRRFDDDLSPIYGEREASAIFYVVLEDILGLARDRAVADPRMDVDEECLLEGVLKELKRGRPVQYVTGRTVFCDMELKVREGVLIPRPETEELVRMIVKDHEGPALRIIDIGTGSGAIAVALAAMIPGAEVAACDISDDALAVAADNAAGIGVKVELLKWDVLAGDVPEVGRFDIIVSNPPYIPRSERPLMGENVLGFEPGIALFVDDGDPLEFYRAIGRHGRSLLREGGRLYFEIHERFGAGVVEILEEEGYRNVGVYRDMFGKERMVRCRKR